MPVDRSCVLSTSQFCELLALDPARFNTVEVDRRQHRIVIVQEPEMTQTTGTFPALTKGGKKIGGKRPGKRGC
jgi:hypothetical protein